MRRRTKWLVPLALLLLGGCLLATLHGPRVRPPRGVEPRTVMLEVTGYCRCGACCGWRRTWYGKPVLAYGPRKGERKKVGYTASGSRARVGTIAADTSVFPFGTVMEVPGYGYGRVEDRGGAIKGHSIDLFFPTHEQALQWGRRRLAVKVWRE